MPPEPGRTLDRPTRCAGGDPDRRQEEPCRSPATWEEALDRTAAGVRAALDRPRAAGAKAPVGIFSCSKSTNEVNYAAQKLSRQVMGSNNIDSCNRT